MARVLEEAGSIFDRYEGVAQTEEETMFLE